MKYYINVAGINFRDWKPSEVGKIAWLVPEPTNTYDPNAIAVYGTIIGDTSRLLGYIPKDKTEEVREMYNNGWFVEEAGLFNGDRKFLKIYTEIPDNFESIASPMTEKKKEDKWIELEGGWTMNEKTRERVKDGKSFYNISSVLNVFNLNGKESAWEDIKISSFSSGKEYNKWLDGKARIGSALHKAIEIGEINNDVLNEFSIAAEAKVFDKFTDWKPTYGELRKMFDNYLEWKREYSVAEVKKETIVSWGGIASPCDMLCRINNMMYVVDFKISKKINKRYEVQSWFYSKAFREEIGIEQIVPTVLLLGMDTQKGYKFHFTEKTMSEEYALKTLEHGVYQLDSAKKIIPIEQDIIWPEPNVWARFHNETNGRFIITEEP